MRALRSAAAAVVAAAALACSFAPGAESLPRFKPNAVFNQHFLNFSYGLYYQVDPVCSGGKSCYWNGGGSKPVPDTADVAGAMQDDLEYPCPMDSKAPPEHPGHSVCKEIRKLAPFPKWEPAIETGYHEFQLGDTLSCLKKRWLFFIGDSLIREQLYVLQLLIGTPIGANLADLYEKEATREGAWLPRRVFEDKLAISWKNDDEGTCQELCLREWLIEDIRFTYIFVGPADKSDAKYIHAYLQQRLDKFQDGSEAPPDAIFFNIGAWPTARRQHQAKHHMGDLNYYEKKLSWLTDLIRSRYGGLLFWLGQTRILPVTSCPDAAEMLQERKTCPRSREGRAAFYELQHNVLGIPQNWSSLPRSGEFSPLGIGSLYTIPIDRMVMAANGYGLQRDSIHFHLPGYIAVGQLILNHLCNVCKDAGSDAFQFLSTCFE